MAIARRHSRGDAILDLFRVHSSVDLAAVTKNRAGESLQVLERVKRCLPRESERRPAVPEIEGNTIDQLGIRYSGTLRCFELTFQISLPRGLLGNALGF